MRFFAFALLLTSLLGTTPAEARLFRQTYGAIVSAAANMAGEDCPNGASSTDCSWNVNEDYFVPRHASACRYDMFSPCKVARTTSPACRSYSSTRLGGCRAPLRAGKRCCPSTGGSVLTCPRYGEEYPVAQPLPGVEPVGFDRLGRIPSEEDGLVASLGRLGAAGAAASVLPSLSFPTSLQSLPLLDKQQSEQLTQPLPVSAEGVSVDGEQREYAN